MKKRGKERSEMIKELEKVKERREREVIREGSDGGGTQE